MKDITMRIQKFSRPGVILMAAVVAIITTIVVANAAQTFTTPNSAFVSYSLAAGANSAPITPATNRSVLVMGCCTSPSFLGVGQVSLLSTNALINWVGLESAPSAAITQGVGSAAGTHIVFMDSLHKVSIQVASGTTIRVNNGDTVTRTGNVTLIW